MSAHPESNSSPQPATLVMSRLFAAPIGKVFEAWSTADHIRRWFSPQHFTVPEADVDFRAGGVFAVCMRSPEGEDHFMRGHFVEVEAPRRLVFTADVTVHGAARFTVLTTITLEPEGDQTRMTVQQAYEVHDPAFVGAIAGAEAGWSTTLSKLAHEMAQSSSLLSAVHGSFSIERVFAASPRRVFQAFADPAAKALWFGSEERHTVLEQRMDVRPGGSERLKARWGSGLVTQFDATYFDVVPDARLVYTYEMHLDGKKISVSLATLQFLPDAGGTRLKVTEQGAFLDGYEDAGAREHGTSFLLERLRASLES